MENEASKERRSRRVGGKKNRKVGVKKAEEWEKRKSRRVPATAPPERPPPPLLPEVDPPELCKRKRSDELAPNPAHNPKWISIAIRKIFLHRVEAGAVESSAGAAVAAADSAGVVGGGAGQRAENRRDLAGRTGRSTV